MQTMDKENTRFNQPTAAARPWNMNQHKQQHQPNAFEKTSSFRGRSEFSADDEMARRAREGKQWTLNDFEIGKPLGLED